MHISYIMFENIRNHILTEFEPSPGLNILVGNNGQGKTATLEAIALCTLSKTFTPSADTSLRRISAEYYSAQIACISDLGIPYKSALLHKTGDRKRFTTSRGKNLSPQDVIGIAPTVALSPDYKSITSGSPAERRKFIDGVISQESALYLKELLRYKTTLKQRNLILQELKNGVAHSQELLAALTDTLATSGGFLLSRRLMFLRQFTPLVHSFYNNIAGADDTIALQYEARNLQLPPEDSDQSAECYTSLLMEQFRTLARAERLRATTLAGPHKDDIIITINGGVAKEFASQGQHKSLLIALKFAEFTFLRNSTSETPIVLLDDIFSELDGDRAANLLDLLGTDVQAFITTTSVRNVHEQAALSAAIFQVQKGTITPIKSLHTILTV